jgi:hypothetical protein
MKMDGMGLVSAEEANFKEPSEYRRPTLRKRLEDRKAMLEKQLVDVNNCLGQLDKNPQLEEFLTAVEKAHV